MNKSDLKTGMIVVTRNGNEYMVMLAVVYSNPTFDPYNIHNVIVSKNGWVSLGSYSHDLKVDNTPELDIVKVYVPMRVASLCNKTISDDYYWECIWREEPPIEMTVAEIKEKLGIKNLKIIKEHDDE